MSRITKREMAFELVSEFGRYMADAPVKKYFIRLGSTSFHSEDTSDLVDLVAKNLSRDALIERLKDLPDDEDTNVETIRGNL